MYIFLLRKISTLQLFITTSKAKTPDLVQSVTKFSVYYRLEIPSFTVIWVTFFVKRLESSLHTLTAGIPLSIYYAAHELNNSLLQINKITQHRLHHSASKPRALAKLLSPTVKYMRTSKATAINFCLARSYTYSREYFPSCFSKNNSRIFLEGFLLPSCQHPSYLDISPPSCSLQNKQIFKLDQY